jgi:hypothetical protein
MVITYYGNTYFKLTLGDLTIATNPPSKSLKPSRFGADIALITTNVEEGNDPETVTLGDKVPFVIDSAELNLSECSKFIIASFVLF